MAAIHGENLRRADLNLLLVLNALLYTSSVSKAADMLCLSQPAVSHALGRLRALLDDPILVRHGRSMTPTVRALRLQPALRELLRQADALFGRTAPFAPAACTDTFSLGVTDYVDQLFLPSIVTSLRLQAPLARLLVRHMALGGATRLLGSGDVDATIAFDLPALAKLPKHEICDEHYACLVAPGHPGFSGKAGLQRYIGESHLLVSPSENFTSLLDMRLAEAGITRRIAVSLPRYSAAPALIAGTGLVGTLPARLANYLAGHFPIEVRPLPVELPPVRLCMFWSERTAHDSAHQWLRAAIVTAVEDAIARSGHQARSPMLRKRRARLTGTRDAPRG